MTDTRTDAVQATLVAHDIEVTFGVGAASVRAVNGVSLTVAAGELVALMGPSGCGKTTLLNVVGGIQEPDGGVVTIAGTDIYRLKDDNLQRFRRANIGIVFQDYNLLRTLTVMENLCLPAEIGGVSLSKARVQAREVLERFDLAQIADRFPSQISGGQQQRVAIARTLIGRHRILLADEPTGALDSDSAAGVLDMLGELVRDGATCLVVTHNPQVADFAHRVITMRDGQITSGTSRA